MRYPCIMTNEDAEQLALDGLAPRKRRKRAPAVKTPAVPHTGTPQCRPGKILFPVAEECRVPGYAAGKSRIGKILDMPHKVAFLIVAGGHKAPYRTGCWINRMRHCSPARPADRP